MTKRWLPEKRLLRLVQAARTPIIWLECITVTRAISEKLLLYEEHTRRLNPLMHNTSLADEARARFHLGDFIAARDIALRVLKEKPRWLTAHSTLVAALWNLGKEEEARSVA